jgi:hypothetical protein
MYNILNTILDTGIAACDESSQQEVAKNMEAINESYDSLATTRGKIR